jgi:hypothetical protein
MITGWSRKDCRFGTIGSPITPLIKVLRRLDAELFDEIGITFIRREVPKEFRYDEVPPIPTGWLAPIPTERTGGFGTELYNA